MSASEKSSAAKMTPEAQAQRAKLNDAVIAVLNASFDCGRWGEGGNEARPYREVLEISIDAKKALMEAIAEALQAERQACFEEIAQRIDKYFMCTDSRIDRVRDYRIDELFKWCRQQSIK